jgi:hypothetical protein
MEWFAQNWFSVLTTAVFIGGWLIQMGGLRTKMAEMEKTLEAVCNKFGEHCSNPDIHVNKLLTALFDERFASIKKEQSETRQDVKRIENLLNKM